MARPRARPAARGSVSAGPSLEEPHPYGVRPSGDALLAPIPLARVRGSGLGRLAPCPDEALLEVLGALDARSLCRTAVVSRALYVFAHHGDLWRNLALQQLGGKAPVQFWHSWKDTCARDASRGRSGSTADAKLAVPRHVPLRVSGVFSDTLFRPWCCCACELRPAWVAEPDAPGGSGARAVPRRAELSVRRFVDEFERPNRPVIITDVVRHWPAFQRWSERGYLERHAGDAHFRATSLGATSAAVFTMGGYAAYARQVGGRARCAGAGAEGHAGGERGAGETGAADAADAADSQSSDAGVGGPAREEAPLYLFERSFAGLAPQLSRDYEQPEHFRFDGDSASAGPDAHATDLFSILGAERRPDHKWLIMGPRRSGSVFHVDPNATNAWNAAIVGRKKWILYPPGTPPPGVHPAAGGADVTLPLSLGEWFLAFWDDHTRRCRSPAPSTLRPFECIVAPGELIFVPHGWWHAVLNLDESVAITQNYVSESNLASVLHFLRSKPDQISGVRDRADAVPAERLEREFCAALRHHVPRALRAANAQIARATRGGGAAAIDAARVAAETGTTDGAAAGGSGGRDGGGGGAVPGNGGERGAAALAQPTSLSACLAPGGSQAAFKFGF